MQELFKYLDNIQENNDNYILLTGFDDLSRISISSEIHSILINSGFKISENWSYGRLRRVYFNNEKKAIFTYCEGDLSLKIFNFKKEYEKQKIENDKFYSKY